MTKFGDTKMRVSPSNGATKIQTFQPLTLEIFRVGKYEKIKIWGYQNEGSPSNGAAKI